MTTTTSKKADTTKAVKGNGKQIADKPADKPVDKPTAKGLVIAARVEQIDVETVIVNEANNSRARVDAAKVKEIAESIKAHGLLQFPIVQERDGKRWLVAGYQRWAALKLLGASTVPCKVIAGSIADALLINYVENDVREDLTPPEQSKALARLVNDQKVPIATVTEACGKSRKHVANLIRLRDKLCPECWEAFTKGRKAGPEGRDHWDVAHWLAVAAEPQKAQMLKHQSLLAADGAPLHPGKAPKPPKDDKPAQDDAPAKAEASPEDAAEQEAKAYKALIARVKQWLTWAQREAGKSDGKVDEAFFDGASAMYNTAIMRAPAGAADTLPHFYGDKIGD